MRYKLRTTHRMMLPQTLETFHSTNGAQFDVLIVACGYESRATHFARLLQNCARRKVALGFHEQQELAYATNREWYRSNGFEFEEPSDTTFRTALEAVVAS